MIHFISRYRQQYYFNKHYWLTKHEQRRAAWLTCGIIACVTITALIWLMK